jgi:hypothetical protein
MRRWILPLALAAELLFFSSGCSLFRRKRAAPLSPPPPPVAAPIPEPKPSEPVIAAPKVSTPAIEAPKQETQTAPPPPVPEKPKPKPRRRTVRRPVEAAPQPPPEPKPETLAQPPPATPRLGEVLTPEQRHELATQLDGNVGEARRILTTLAGRALTREQYDTAARVRSFIKQALVMRSSDIGSAVELSRRALLLARDLAAAR